MPLPRFDRLPEERRAGILKVARQHFARDGRDRASYNQIIADAQIAKTSAYQYFDSKDDVARAVLADVNARLLQVLGPWQQVDDARAFWKQLKACTSRLSEHLTNHPDDLACLRALGLDDGGDAHLVWFEAVIENGVAIALIRKDVDRSLILAATVGFFRAVDRWAIEAIGRGAAPPMKQVWALLAGLWGGRP